MIGMRAVTVGCWEVVGNFSFISFLVDLGEVHG